MKISIGCDEAAYALKEIIKNHLLDKGIEVMDFGVKSEEEKALYPNVALEVSKSITSNQSEYGILVCGTGIGMAITANKVPGIRAAVCHDVYSTERSKKSNDAQVMCMGSRVIAPELALLLVDTWIDSEFAGGGSTEKVEKIKEIENQFSA